MTKARFLGAVGTLLAATLRAQSPPSPRFEATSVRRNTSGSEASGGWNWQGSAVRATNLTPSAQSPAPGASPAQTPTFDVVSIKRNTTGAAPMTTNQSPGGGFNLVNGPISALIAAAYPGLPNPIGLPDWGRSERYDVVAKASLDRVPTPDERRSMMRALLVERLTFAAHIETQDKPAFDLVLARGDGKPGPGLSKIELDCVALAAAQAAAAQAARAAGTLATPSSPTPSVPGAPPPCGMRSSGNVMEGDMTMAGLAGFLRGMAGRAVVDKTNLTGYYHVKLEVSRTLTPPTPDAGATDDAPSVFVAIQEQLGLKLESARSQVDVLIIDHIERPSEN